MAAPDNPKPSKLGATLAAAILIAIFLAFYLWPSAT